MRQLRAKHPFFTTSTNNQPAGPFLKNANASSETHVFIVSADRGTAEPNPKIPEAPNETLVFIASADRGTAESDRWGRGWGEGRSVLYP